VEELPGVNTQGRTLKEVRENLQEALRLIIEANKELAAKSQADTFVIKEPIIIEM
ncbi:MAG TPA: type II toxin-antitoxin system HicB family antitoxin, partial [Dehalococcoidia bacterium]|nr:type II toxin-antitoxin system HicB family antitoxin [Dehalococcoidia bacterium]